MSMTQDTYMYYDSNIIYKDREKNFLTCECGQKQCTWLARLYDL